MMERDLPVELSKGANMALRELDEELGSLTVVLETAGTDAAVDADVSVLLLGGDGRVRSNDDMIFYNQDVALDGAIRLREKVRSHSNDQEVVLETVTVDLDDVPDDVQRIVMAASLDQSLGVSFGAAAHVRMRIQRSADGQDLLQYDVSDISDETALLFGEFYRRDGLWRVRAIGQGYSGGLPHLATDFGVEVAPAAGEATTVDEPEAPADARRDDSLTKGDGQLPDAAGRLSVRRPQRAPKMPAEWRKTIPADDAQDWTPARLFSVAGIGGAEEQEQRATSALLAVAGLVKEFGRALVLAMGGPAGVIETFTEVRFGQEEKMVRPDGVLRSSWGQRQWTALIEVKTARPLSAAQIDSYVEVARAEHYDAVVIISNGLSIGPDDYLVDIDRRKLSKITVCHLGWDEIRTLATTCLEHRGVADTTQRRVLAEFLRYMDHPRSGTHGVTDMGPHWVKVRDSVKNKTLRPADRGAAEVINRFDQLVKHVGLGLAGVLGVDVQTTLPGTSETLSRSQQLSDSGVLFGAIRVPGAVDELVVCMDVARERVSCAVTVPAPRDGRPTTRVTWLLRQLETAPDTLRVEAMLAGGRGQSLAENLKTVRSSPGSVLAKDGREIRAFRLTLELPTSSRDVGRGNVIIVVETVTYRFYAEVVQHLQRWVAARPPKLPGT